MRYHINILYYFTFYLKLICTKKLSLQNNNNKFPRGEKRYILKISVVFCSMSMMVFGRNAIHIDSGETDKLIFHWSTSQAGVGYHTKEVIAGENWLRQCDLSWNQSPPPSTRFSSKIISNCGGELQNVFKDSFFPRKIYMNIE